MAWYYETNFALDLTTNAEHEQWVEIRNPSNSGRTLQIARVGITSQAEFCVFRVTRYDTLATHGAGDDAPTLETSRKWDPNSPTPMFEVYSGEPDVCLIWPSTGNITYTHDFQLDPSDAGDDDKIQWNQYLDDDRTVVIPPGCSAALGFPAGEAEFIVKLLIREIYAQPAPHIASALLPVAGAYTATTYFDVPVDWDSLTFWVTYTAHGSSSNARPKWRVSFSPDGSTHHLQPVVDTVLDIAASPVARRGQYQLEEQWPATVTASNTVNFIVPINIPSGTPKVRLDVAELGDTTNRGTVAVAITGKRT